MRDEHCHILWGVDDGAGSWGESLAMLDAAAQAGITELVATPHARWSDFDPSLVGERYAQLALEAAARGIQTQLGYEVYYATMMEHGLDWAAGLVREGTSELLLEFNTGGAMEYGWEQVFDRLQTEHGLDLVLAHPERYTTVLENFDVVYRLKDMGVRIQVSAGDAYLGAFNPMAKCTKRLLKEGLADAIVSDAHCADHYGDYVKLCSKWG